MFAIFLSVYRMKAHKALAYIKWEVVYRSMFTCSSVEWQLYRKNSGYISATYPSHTFWFTCYSEMSTQCYFDLCSMQWSLYELKVCSMCYFDLCWILIYSLLFIWTVYLLYPWVVSLIFVILLWGTQYYFYPVNGILICVMLFDMCNVILMCEMSAWFLHCYTYWNNIILIYATLISSTQYYFDPCNNIYDQCNVVSMYT